jgi:hypothetical protein
VVHGSSSSRRIDSHVSVSLLPRARPLPSTPASAWSSLQSPHRLMPQPWKEKSRYCHRRKLIPLLLSTPHSNPTRRNLSANDAQDHPSLSSHAPRMPRPYPPCPKRNPRLAAIKGIAIQSPRRHPAHRTTIGPHPIASAGPPRHLILPILRASPARIFRCSSTSHSTRQPHPDLAMLEYEMKDTSLSAQIWTPYLSKTQTDLVYKIENYSCGCSSDNFRFVFLSFIYVPFSPIDCSFIICAPFP